jgi:hypothetical protein
LRHNVPVSEARAQLLEALQRVADGGDITAEELDATVSDPLTLDRVEKDAWEQLSHWADDGDIRAKDAQYATFKRELMRDHIAALNGYLSDEIERGEHQAQHIPLWGCGAAILLVALVAYLLLS